MKCTQLVNRELGYLTYSLECKVNQLIKEARRLVKFPHVEVIITHDSNEALGVALMGGGIMWISERATVSRAVVFHEILHAVFEVDHVKGCPLMDEKIDPRLDKELCDALFIKYTEFETCLEGGTDNELE